MKILVVLCCVMALAQARVIKDENDEKPIAGVDYSDYETTTKRTTTKRTTIKKTTTTKRTTERTTERTTVPTIEPTTESTTERTTEPTTERTTEPTIEPTTERTTEPTTERTTEWTTEQEKLPGGPNPDDPVPPVIDQPPIDELPSGPHPEDETPAEEGGEETPPPEGGGEGGEGGEGEGEETPAPAEGEETPPPEEDNQGQPAEPEEDAADAPPEEAIPPEEEPTTEKENLQNVLHCPTENPTIDATLLIPKDDQPPDNVVTDKSGSPVTDAIETQFILPRKTVLIYSESWRTYYTTMATKVNCMCQTRGPLSRFKLIGNLHFKNIKIPINRRRSSSTENAITDCPPCNCEDCFTTESSTTKRKKVC